MKVLYLCGYNSEALHEELLRKRYELLLLSEKINIDVISDFKPDWCISYNYRHIVPRDVIQALPFRIINLHISYLPWNRGAHPILWSVIENTPMGVSVHFIDEHIDTGPIIARKKVLVSDDDTLRSAYAILQQEVVRLFLKYWDNIVVLKYSLIEQSSIPHGSLHYKKDFDRVKYLLEPYGWDISIGELKKRVSNAIRNFGSW